MKQKIKSNVGKLEILLLVSSLLFLLGGFTPLTHAQTLGGITLESLSLSADHNTLSISGSGIGATAPAEECPGFGPVRKDQFGLFGSSYSISSSFLSGSPLPGWSETRPPVNGICPRSTGGTKANYSFSGNIDVSTLSNGNYTITVNATDGYSGGIVSSSGSFTISRSRAIPTPSLSASAYTLTADTQDTVTLYVDNGLGGSPATLYYSGQQGSGNLVICTTNSSGSCQSQVFGPFTSRDVGTWNYHTIVADRQSNSISIAVLPPPAKAKLGLSKIQSTLYASSAGDMSDGVSVINLAGSGAENLDWQFRGIPPIPWITNVSEGLTGGSGLSPGGSSFGSFTVDPRQANVGLNNASITEDCNPSSICEPGQQSATLGVTLVVEEPYVNINGYTNTSVGPFNPGQTVTLNLGSRALNASAPVVGGSLPCNPNGSCSFPAPSVTTTYDIRVKGISNVDTSNRNFASASVTVNVAPSPISVTLNASPTNMTLPENSTRLNWATSGSPTSCRASGDWNGNRSTTDSSENRGNLSAGTYNYTITCSKSGVADASASVTVVVNPIATYSLTVSKNGAGAGTVTSSPSGINCGSTCSSSYTDGTTVTLTAFPNNGSTFGGWSGSCSGGGNCTVNMNQSHDVVATFNVADQYSYTVIPSSLIFSAVRKGPLPSPQNFTITNTGNRSLTIGVSENATWANINKSSVDLAPGASTNVSVSVTTTNLTPSTYSGTANFSNTQGAGGQSRDIRYTISSAPLENFNLTVSKNGAGTVTSSPSGINCGSDCSESYNEGASVTLTATPSGNFTFGGWGGDCSGASQTCTVSMTQTRNVTATFNLPATKDLTVSIDSGLGTVTGSGINCPGDCFESYPSNGWITLFADFANGYRFDGWTSGGNHICAGQGRVCSYYLDGNKSAGANFSLIPTPFNYSLSNSGNSSVIKTSGDAYTQNTITKTYIAGTTQSVSLSLSGVPTGATYSTSNSSCSPSCTSVITFTVAPSTPAGTYPITVTGAPLGKSTNFNLIVSGNPVSPTCSVSPTSALIGQSVTWSASVSGGTPPFSYSWSGSGIPTNPSPDTNPFNISYSTTGIKTATVTVTDADSLTGSCPAATVQINFDPHLEEF